MLKKFLKERRALAQSMKVSTERESETVEMCRKCYSFRYADAWHFERPDYLLEKEADERIAVKFSQCPACVEEALAMYDMEYV